MEEVLSGPVASAIFEAYLAGGARDFFCGHYADAGDRRRALERARRPLAPAVASALARQNALFTPSPARAAHLAALDRGAVAVVTGQQVGLFLGPLYTVYKAASAVAVARALAEESAEPVVPIFWLQTEDHDLPEIDHCHVPCARAEPLRLSAGPAADDRISIAHLTLPGEISACIERLGAEIGNLPHADRHLERLARHYRPGAGWAEAFAGLLAELFAEEGLLLIDPRHPELASAVAPIHRRALIDAAPISAALAARSRSLEAAGYGATVHVRAGAPLSFLHPDGPEGPRYRLEPSGDRFAEVGGTRVHGVPDLLATLDADPLRFSTSALLRPILQDSLLPVAAYVGGPAEVAYFAQLAPLYATYDVAMPLIVPRARLRVVEEKARRLLARLGLTADTANQPEDEILAAASGAGSAPVGRGDLARALVDPFHAALRALQEQSEPETGAAFEKTRATVEAAVSRLGDKLEKAHRARDHALVQDVRHLKMLLYPNGVPQERLYGLPYFAARYGERPFIDNVLSTIAPFDPTPKDLSFACAGPSEEMP